MAVDGKDILLLVEDNGTFTAIASQTNLTREYSRDMIDASSKDSDFRDWLYGKQEGSMTLEALYVPDEASWDLLRDAQNNRTSIVVRRSEFGVEIEEATALIATISDEWPDSDVSTVTVELNMTTRFEAVPPGP